MKKLFISLSVFTLISFAFVQNAFTLQIIHSSDNESAFQDPNTLEDRILNYAAIVEGLRELSDNTLYLTAGDHTLPGPYYEAAAEVESLGANGLGDIAIYNAMSLTANGIGNHEFDGGINDFAHMLARANYPFIAVNLDFSQVELAQEVPKIELGVDGGSVTENAGKIVKSAYAEVGGEKIGIIGRAPADFFNVIEDPESNLPGLDFIGGRNLEDNQPLISAVEQVLEQIELLEDQGINKIILLDHAQDFTADPLSAQTLADIDVIVTAGSTGFMARADAQGPFNNLRERDEAQTFYPTLRLDSEGHLVLVINSDQLYKYVGRLVVDFNSEGHIIRVDPLSGPIATTEEAVSALAEVVGKELSAPEEVVKVYDGLQNSPTIQEAFEIVGTTTSVLNGARANVRTVETNLGRLAADSTLWFARGAFPDMLADIALKNGGGIRDTILGPSITKLTVNTALAFDNKISVVELTATELIATMENAVSRVPAADGRFPQVAGLYLEYSPNNEGISDQVSLETPSRLKTLIVTRVDGSEDVLVESYRAKGDLTRTFVLATNSFLLTGGDGYQALKTAGERNSVTTEQGEREVLVTYINEVLAGEVNIPEPIEDLRVVAVEDN